MESLRVRTSSLFTGAFFKNAGLYRRRQRCAGRFAFEVNVEKTADIFVRCGREG